MQEPTETTCKHFTTATTYSGLCCPRCGSHSFRKHGYCLGIQRFRCKQCGRSFNETVNTPLHWIHYKQKMVQYAATLPEHLSISKTACKIGISGSTSFAWRHKILSSFISSGTTQSTSPAGACQITMPRSYKGIRKLPIKPAPAARTILVVDGRGIPCLQLLPDKCTALRASQILTKSLSQSAAIVCQPAKLLVRAAEIIGNPALKQRTIRKKLLAKTNLVQAQLEFWMDRFNGVATKYLQQYWNWYLTETRLAQSVDEFLNECFAYRRLKDYRMIIAD